MRNTPSFVCELTSKTKQKSTSDETKIEKEADLREKRKQILQRLKNKHMSAAEILLTARIENEISEKVIFSPRTAKRFKEFGSRTEFPERLAKPGIMAKKSCYISDEMEENDDLRKPDLQELAEECRYKPSFGDNSLPVRQVIECPKQEKKLVPSLKVNIDDCSQEGSSEIGLRQLQEKEKSSSLQKRLMIKSSSFEIDAGNEEILTLKRSLSSQGLDPKSFTELEKASETFLGEISRNSHNKAKLSQLEKEHNESGNVLEIFEKKAATCKQMSAEEPNLEDKSLENDKLYGKDHLSDVKRFETKSKASRRNSVNESSSRLKYEDLKCSIHLSHGESSIAKSNSSEEHGNKSELFGNNSAVEISGSWEYKDSKGLQNKDKSASVSRASDESKCSPHKLKKSKGKSTNVGTLEPKKDKIKCETSKESKRKSKLLKVNGRLDTIEDKQCTERSNERHRIRAEKKERPSVEMESLQVDYRQLSSTTSLKIQQDKLEEDFHKLEEDLDRAFRELRNYLKTS